MLLHLSTLSPFLLADWYLNYYEKNWVCCETFDIFWFFLYTYVHPVPFISNQYIIFIIIIITFISWIIKFGNAFVYFSMFWAVFFFLIRWFATNKLIIIIFYLFIWMKGPWNNYFRLIWMVLNRMAIKWCTFRA